eukprot:TRINITY_DN4617_c0_g1_i1.p2 TRINITY_DN4617_c0_g1~~TRINITY_DN4617_c0_g1_i1.p2  ORF type:complete len:394 (+),score=123.41 TRINITY_DN4617_c0_g1_i1:125-1306(+)
MNGKEKRDIVGFQLGNKLSKIKLIKNNQWRRQNAEIQLELDQNRLDSTSSSSSLPFLAVTCHWDSSNSNQLSLYSIPSPHYYRHSPSSKKMNHSMEDPYQFFSNENNSNNNGEIIDIQIVESASMGEFPLIVTNDSKAKLSIYSLETNQMESNQKERKQGDIQLVCQSSIQLDHRGASSSLSIHSEKKEMASGGEDGKVILLDQDGHEKTKWMADSLSIQSIAYLSRESILTASLTSQIKRWDLRQTDRPTGSTIAIGPMNSFVHCISQHPLQPSIFATGSSNGTVFVWDERLFKLPVAKIEAHQSNIWEIRFHPTNPDQILSCSNDGSVTICDTNAFSDNNRSSFKVESGSSVKTLIQNSSIGGSVNSFDYDRGTNSIVCCSDNGYLYMKSL